MPYSEFSFTDVRKNFDLSVYEPLDLFEAIPEVMPSDFLVTTLNQNRRFAGGVNMEKAKSELIVSPILLEVCRFFDFELGYFSGVEFNVDPTQKLTGYCDFILAATPSVFEIRTPVVMIVEAKNDNIASGLGQCAAEMVAANIKNLNEGNQISSMMGAITTGNEWKFLLIETTTMTLRIDRREYFLTELGKILGIVINQLQEVRERSPKQH